MEWWRDVAVVMFAMGGTRLLDLLWPSTGSVESQVVANVVLILGGLGVSFVLEWRRP